ncbi:MAG: hypothetical protein WC901_07725 [Candidatus Margulisiibacteriota bacterium]
MPIKIYNLHAFGLAHRQAARTPNLAGWVRVRLVCGRGVADVRLVDLPHLLTETRYAGLGNASVFAEPQDLRPNAAAYLESVRAVETPTFPIIERLERESAHYSPQNIVAAINSDREIFNADNGCWLTAFALWQHYHMQPTLTIARNLRRFAAFANFVALGHVSLSDDLELQKHLGIFPYAHPINRDEFAALPHLTLVEARLADPVMPDNVPGLASLGLSRASHFFMIMEGPGGGKYILEKHSSRPAVFLPVTQWRSPFPVGSRPTYFASSFGSANALLAMAHHFYSRTQA